MPQPTDVVQVGARQRRRAIRYPESWVRKMAYKSVYGDMLVHGRHEKDTKSLISQGEVCNVNLRPVQRQVMVRNGPREWVGGSTNKARKKLRIERSYGSQMHIASKSTSRRVSTCFSWAVMNRLNSKHRLKRLGSCAPLGLPKTGGPGRFTMAS